MATDGTAPYSPDELAGLADQFGALTPAELRRAVEELSFKRGASADEDAVDAALDRALDSLHLVAVERGGERLLAPARPSGWMRPDLSGVRAHDADAVTGEERRAAVLAPVVERADGDHLLFIRRADHLGEHPGQMGFPGGGREPSDADLRATALREAEEEVGLRPEEAEVVGHIDDVRTVSEYAVRPFVGRVPDRTYDPDHREVADVVILPVAALCARENYESERRDHPHYGEVRIHFFHVDGYTVWGVTGRMLVRLLELTTEWRAPETVDRVVDPDADLPL